MTNLVFYFMFVVITELCHGFNPQVPQNLILKSCYLLKQRFKKLMSHETSKKILFVPTAKLFTTALLNCIDIFHNYYSFMRFFWSLQFEFSALLLTTLGPAYNEYGYYEHPATMRRFLCTNFLPLTAMVKKFGYYKQICLLSHLQQAKRSHCS